MSNPASIINVKPSQIRWSLGRYGGDGAKAIKGQIYGALKRNEALVLPGDWDILSGSFAHYSPYHRSKAVQISGGNYKGTEYYQQCGKTYNKDSDKLWSRWDAMYDDINSHGYSVRPCSNKLDEYITVSVSRSGQILFYNGQHRLAILLLTGRDDYIPVRVIIRHPEWLSLRESLLKRREYCKFPHPDLQDVPAAWDLKRAEIIVRRLPDNCTVLDAGAHHGAVSMYLAYRGHRVTGVEVSRAPYGILHRVSKIYGYSFTAVLGGLFDRKEKRDVLLLLNVVWHFMQDADVYRCFLEHLKLGLYGRIYYQGHNADETESKKLKVRLNQDQCAQQIMQYAGLSRVQMLQVSKNQHGLGRKLYEIT